MLPYRLLIPDGHSYKIRKLCSLFCIIIIAWLFIGIAILKYSDYIKTGIGIIVFALLPGALLIFKAIQNQDLPQSRNH